MTGRLRVAVLASGVAGTHGLGRCTRGLLSGLGARDDITVVPVVPRGDLSARFALDDLALPNAEAPVLLPAGGQLGTALCERYALGAALRHHEVDVAHGLKHLVPRTRRATVLTVHDVLTLTWPQQFERAKRWFLPHEYRASLRAATMLVAVSETTKRRLAAFDPAWEAKTVVVPNGRTDALLEVDARPVDKLVETRFAIVVGDLSPRKNVGFLLGIWPEVHAATGLLLAVVGTPGWQSDGTRRRLLALEEAGIALWARDVTDGELRWCYEHAVLAVFPTLEEGYGIPVVEALRVGIPVIASTDPAVVEVARGLARHVDVSDRAAWIRAVTETASDPGSRAPAVASGLTWTENAAATVAVYREARARLAGNR